MTTRREMLMALSAMAVVPACGGGGGTDAGGGGGTDTGGSACGATIEVNHGHVLSVSRADVEAAAPRTYDIQGTSAHTHSVTLSAADFGLLATSGTVSVTSTTGGAHTHTVTVRCT